MDERGECAFSWTSRQGYPVGVVAAYVYREARSGPEAAKEERDVDHCCDQEDHFRAGGAALSPRPPNASALTMVVLNRDPDAVRPGPAMLSSYCLVKRVRVHGSQMEVNHVQP
jgi:hypothetical protein